MNEWSGWGLLVPSLRLCWTLGWPGKFEAVLEAGLAWAGRWTLGWPEYWAPIVRWH